MNRAKIAFIVGLMVLAAGVGFSAYAEDAVIVGCEIAWPPFEWVATSGDYVGFDLDLLRCIAILEGLEFELRDSAFDSLIPGVQIGQFDMVISGVTIRPDREEVIDFSDPYFDSNQAIVIRADSGLTLGTVLAGLGTTKLIAVQRGSVGDKWVEALEEAGANVSRAVYENDPEAVLAVKTGRADAMIQGVFGAQESVRAYPEMLIAGVVYTYEEFGALVATGDPLGLLAKFNAGLKQVRALGIYDNLFAAYFGPELSVIEQAWAESKSLLDAGDVEGFAASLAEKANE